MMQATVPTADHILSLSPHLLCYGLAGLDSLNNTPTKEQQPLGLLVFSVSQDSFFFFEKTVS